MIVKFPPVHLADRESGLLAVGGDLEVASLELAYRNGIFPWPVSEGDPVLWFAPARRAILDFDALQVPKRLQRELRNSHFRFRVNTCFHEVILSCASSKNRKSQSGTWITREMIAAYSNLHRVGLASCFEAFNPQDELVGGMYGVLIGKYFAGESMFYKEPNASKFVFVQTVAYLRARGFKWMDVQVLTPLLASFGAVEIPRRQFMRMLSEALARGQASLHE